MPGLSQLQSWDTDTVTYELYQYIMPGLSQLQSWHTDNVTYGLYQYSILCQGCLSSNRGTLAHWQRNIWTIPVQYIMPGLSQLQSWHTDKVAYGLTASFFFKYSISHMVKDTIAKASDGKGMQEDVTPDSHGFTQEDGSRRLCPQSPICSRPVPGTGVQHIITSNMSL